MASYTGRAKEARRKATESFFTSDEQRANAVQKERALERTANAEKTVRLKALRLDKEAGERAAALLEKARAAEIKALRAARIKQPRASTSAAAPPSRDPAETL